MTTKEEKALADMMQLMRDVKAENATFKEGIKQQIEAMNAKTEKKHLPIYLEQDILRASQEAVNNAVKDVLSKYDSPLVKLVKSVVEENSSELRVIISDSFTQVIRTSEFKQSIVSAFAHKVVRTIISNNDGLFDKVANELKQDTVFKSKMAIAVANVVEECLNERTK